MTAYLDHVFVTCGSGAPEADVLLGQGLIEGSGNVHPGQGTANRRFFFSNFMLELLWVCDPADASSAAAEPSGLWPRWTGRGAGASRCGLIYGGAPPADLPTRPYHPAYIPPGRAIEVACDIPLTEPALFFLPWLPGLPGLAGRGPGAEPVAHAAPLREITGAALGVPDPGALSAPLQLLRKAGLLEVFPCSTQLLEIRFRLHTEACLDGRPRLPLVLRGMRT